MDEITSFPSSKDASVPGNYRLIGLEFCFLRVFTLLIDRRLQTWMQANGILPETQNGFRLGYHGLNNPFILRTAIDVALAEGKTLYVVFPDLTNAFPWLDLSSLWSMMYRKGIAGSMFDWIRMLYGAMTYVVRLNGVMSDPFSSTIGLMTGDNGSPGFWNFFSSDLKFRPHEDDIWIGEHQVMNIEHADDGALFSSARGLQSHLDEYSRWTNQKGLCVNIAKTKAMVFSRVPETLPTFRINGDPVEWVNEHRYLGVNFTSSHANIFKIHYGIKSKVAKKMASTTFTLDKLLGDLPPREGLILYNSRIDPHLTYGTEVAIDVSLNDVALLENVQRLYMRRLLHLYRRSMIDVLWSETGMWPLAYRRIWFALRYLDKVLLLPEYRIPVWCVEANVTLWTRQKSCWLGDIAVVLRRLGLPESQISLEALTDAGQVVELINALPVLIREKVRDVIEGSTKLPLMQGRIERLPRNGSSKSQ